MKISKAVLHYIRVKSRFLKKTIKNKKTRQDKRGKEEPAKRERN
jgi:hypothetical protein